LFVSQNAAILPSSFNQAVYPPRQEAKMPSKISRFFRAPRGFALPLLAATLALAAGTAHATPVLTYTATDEGSATPPAGDILQTYTPPTTGSGAIDFGNGTVVTFANPSGSAYPAQAVNGTVVNQYAAPIAANGQAVTSNYYSTGLGTVNIQFATPQSYLGLLWGSADLGNELSFYSNGNLVGEINTADFDSTANGNQGVGGSYFINADVIGGTFNQIVASSSFVSFEFANVEAGSTPSSVPEPSSLALLGAALIACGVIRQRGFNKSL